MIDRGIFEIAAGSIALLAGLLGSYLIVQGTLSGLITFAALAGLLIVSAAYVLVTRVRHMSYPEAPEHVDPATHSDEQPLLDLLIKQLPSELVLQLRTKNAGVPTAASVVDSFCAHVEAQRELLDRNFRDLVHGNSELPVLVTESESEQTLRLLFTELAALEDQFATDLHHQTHAGEWHQRD